MSSIVGTDLHPSTYTLCNLLKIYVPYTFMKESLDAEDITGAL